MKKIIFSILFILSIVSFSFIPKFQKQDPPFLGNDNRWADSVFKTLSPDERIAQLFMVAAYSNKDKTHVKEIKKLVDEYKIGGLIFHLVDIFRQKNEQVIQLKNHLL